MMKRAFLLSVGIVAATLLFTGSTLAAPTLVNGDAETGDLTGWVTSDPQIGAVASQSQATGTVYPYEGDFFFSFALGPARGSVNDPPATIGMYQTGTTGLDGTGLRLTGWVQTENRSGSLAALVVPDAGEAILAVYDSDDVLLASASTGILVTPNLQWQPFAVELDDVSGAAYWRVDLLGTVNDGTYVNAFYDGVELSSMAVPAPGAVLLGSLGAGLVGWMRRRKAL